MRNLTRAQLIYVIDREAFDTHWSTIGQAIHIQDRRVDALRAADALLAGGFDVVSVDVFAPYVSVPETVLQLIQENP